MNLENPICVGTPVDSRPSFVPVICIPDLPLPEQGPRNVSRLPMTPSDKVPFKHLGPE